MTVAFYLDNRIVRGVDFSHPEDGNPGCGASEYLQVAIPAAIRQATQTDAVVFTYEPLIGEATGALHVTVGSILDAIREAKDRGVEYFVFRARTSEEEGVLGLIDELEVPSIAIAHLTPNAKHIRRMARSPHLKALVCVGREQYDYLIDTPIHRKLTYIDNGIHVASCGHDDIPTKDNQLVVYMGALVPQKGFHLLAEAWPRVLDRFPEAKLSVIGSSRVYEQDRPVGPLGVADAAYERSFSSYLMQNGVLDSSVTFHGKMGKEKTALLRSALVGVVNPSGQTETCCVSAIEMAACFVPVVTGAFTALPDTVIQGETGLLGRTIPELAENICALLGNPARALKIGVKARARAWAKYDFSVVAPQWVELFEALNHKRLPSPSRPIGRLMAQAKFVRVLNRPFQRLLGSVMPWPSLQEAEGALRRLRGFLRSALKDKAA